MKLPTNLDYYYPITKTNIILRAKPMYPQFFIENIADPAHIKYVHMAGYIRSGSEYEWNGPNWGGPEEIKKPRMTVGAQAMSMIATRGHPTQPQLGDYDYSEQINVVATAPVDDGVTDVFLVTYMAKEKGYEGDELGPRAAKALRFREKNIQLDFFLFDHCIYLDGPPWPPEESKTWIEVRHWARHPPDPDRRRQARRLHPPGRLDRRRKGRPRRHDAVQRLHRVEGEGSGLLTLRPTISDAR
jgi:hypothetical protein